MIRREIEPYLRAVFKKFPVVTITGPRQSGKTTLVKHVFPSKPYINLEHPEEREFAASDPRAFFRRYPAGAVLDEVQRVPALLSYIQSIVDERGQNGLFVLTGSSQFELMRSISQSLAGRTALLKLLPFSLSELRRHADFPGGIDEMIHRGFYPRLYDQDLDPVRAYGDYLETYVERDLRHLAAVKNLGLFQKFVRLCAGRIGQVLNLSSLGNDIGVSHTTAREWITLLETSYIIFLLEPYHRNIGKRLIKSPKLYFYDVGLAAYLIGIENLAHIAHHPLRGNLFENLVLMEFLKYRFNKGQRSNLSFFRDRTGNEIDLLYTISENILAVEVKSGETLSGSLFKSFAVLDQALKIRHSAKALVYGGDRRETRSGIQITDVYGIKPLLNAFEKTSSADHGPGRVSQFGQTTGLTS